MHTAVFDGKTAVEHAHDAAQAVRAINHLTMHATALPYPSEAWRLLGHLSTMASRLPQAFEQITAQLRVWQRDGRIGIDPGTPFAGQVDLAVATAAIELTDHAAVAAAELAQALTDAHHALTYAHYLHPDGHEDDDEQEPTR